MIIVFTGNGKGKTTAAIGQAIRAIGQNKKVAIFQFIKSEKYPSGEDFALKKFKKNLLFIKGGRGFVGILNDKLPVETHMKTAEDTLEKAKKAIFSKKFSLVILDEINVALRLNLIKKEKILSLIKIAPKNIDLILTGRNAPKELLDIADLATNFKEIKHPFQKGKRAKKGIEY